MDILTDIKERLEFLKEMGVTELKVISPRSESAISNDASLSERVRHCKKCGLASERINALSGEGGAPCGIMFVSMTPSEEEDKEGVLFSGKGGDQLLRIITGAFKMTKKDVYVTNAVKCRGNGGRPPSQEEIGECRSYLEEEINSVRPKIIITLGDGAVKALLNRSEGVSRLRGKFYSYKGIRLTPIYHPIELVLNPSLKRDTNEDIKMVVSEINPTAGIDEKGR